MIVQFWIYAWDARQRISSQRLAMSLRYFTDIVLTGGVSLIFLTTVSAACARKGCSPSGRCMERFGNDAARNEPSGPRAVYPLDVEWNVLGMPCCAQELHRKRIGLRGQKVRQQHRRQHRASVTHSKHPVAFSGMFRAANIFLN